MMAEQFESLGLPEAFCAALLAVAIRDSEAAKLIDCMASGGMVTYDPVTERLVYATAEQLRGLGEFIHRIPTGESDT